MKEFFDTSMLIAAFWAVTRTTSQRQAIGISQPETGDLRHHTLAEVYAVMTS